MTVKEIYEQVLLDVPKIEMRNFIKRYNEAVEMLSIRYDTANAKKTAYIDATDSEQVWYDLPSDCKGVIRVTNEEGRELRTYICEGKSINPGYVGSFNIEYIGTSTKLITMNTVQTMQTGIDDMYGLAIVKFILAYEMPDRFQLYMQMFEEIASKANDRLSSVKRKNMRIAVKPFR